MPSLGKIIPCQIFILSDSFFCVVSVIFILVEIEKNQTFEISQATQTIPTSDYGIIRIKDSNNT